MSERVDDQGRAYKKSRRQIQTAVNERSDELERKLLEALPDLAALDPTLTWISPVEGDRYREYRDGALLARIGLSDLSDALKEYWPSRGPAWDAVAVARSIDGELLGPVLVEAKSYPKELRSSCQAEGDRREKIEKQLRAQAPPPPIRKTCPTSRDEAPGGRW